jgi:hypothetical protein
VLLTVLSPLWPVFQWLWPNGVITTEELGRAMILAVRKGGPKRVLESADLVALGRSDTAGMNTVRTRRVSDAGGDILARDSGPQVS